MIYKNNFGFKNSLFIPNLYTFDKNKTPSSNLTYKNVLMLGRFDDIIKGGKYGIYAMAEILKEIPDAKLTIIIPSQAEKIVDLIKQLNILHIFQFSLIIQLKVSSFFLFHFHIRPEK